MVDTFTDEIGRELVNICGPAGNIVVELSKLGDYESRGYLKKAEWVAAQLVLPDTPVEDAPAEDAPAGLPEDLPEDGVA
jgi:hypothetical protein